jgi:hypothetical protein
MENNMHARVVAIRTAAIGLCALTLLAAACSSSGGHNATADTTEPTSAAVTSTTDRLNTPNSIPYVVGEQIALANGWIVRVAAVHYPASVPGLAAIAAGDRYVVIDLMLANNGVVKRDVKADELFTLTDGLHNAHYVIPRPETANGIDGSYPPGAKHTGTLTFTAPKNQRLGLILAGPRIGTEVSFFTIDPPTVPPDQT